MVSNQGYAVYGSCFSGHTFQNPILGSRGCAIGTHAIFNRHPALHILAQRRLNDPMRLAHLPVHNRQVILLDLPIFPNSTQLARRFQVFGYDCDAAGLAVQPVHQVRP